MDHLLNFLHLFLDYPLTIPLSGATGILIYVAKIAINEAIKDRQQKRDARDRVAQAQTDAFNAHVRECALRALAHTSLEGKMDSLADSLDEAKSSLEKHTGRLDTLFEMVVAHIPHVARDSEWRNEIHRRMDRLDQAG